VLEVRTSTHAAPCRNIWNRFGCAAGQLFVHRV